MLNAESVSTLTLRAIKRRLFIDAIHDPITHDLRQRLHHMFLSRAARKNVRDADTTTYQLVREHVPVAAPWNGLRAHVRGAQLAREQALDRRAKLRSSHVVRVRTELLVVQS